MLPFSIMFLHVQVLPFSTVIHTDQYSVFTLMVMASVTPTALIRRRTRILDLASNRSYLGWTAPAARSSWPLSSSPTFTITC